MGLQVPVSLESSDTGKKKLGKKTFRPVIVVLLSFWLLMAKRLGVCMAGGRYADEMTRPESKLVVGKLTY